MKSGNVCYLYILKTIKGIITSMKLGGFLGLPIILSFSPLQRKMASNGALQSVFIHSAATLDSPFSSSVSEWYIGPACIVGTETGFKELQGFIKPRSNNTKTESIYTVYNEILCFLLCIYRYLSSNEITFLPKRIFANLTNLRYL